MIWIPILDPNSRYRPTKTISPVGKGQKHAPLLSVCLYGLSVRGLGLVIVVPSTGRAQNVPDPTSCRDVHHILSVTIPTCQGFHNRLFRMLFSATL